jgi:hypothetical protein
LLKTNFSIMKFLIVLAVVTIFCSANAKSLNKRDLRDDLLTRAKNLEESASAAINKLTADGRSAEATHLQNEEKRLQELAQQLKEATTESDIHHLEVEIRAVENRLSNELRRLGRGAITGEPAIQVSRLRRDLKDDLLKKAADLSANATAEIKKLQSNNMTALAAGIEYEQKRVQEIADELKNANGPETIRLLELELTRTENRLAQEIRALSRDPQSKEQLLEKAVALEKQIDDEVKKLKDSKPAVAAFLIHEKTLLEGMAVELTLASTTFGIRALEVQLRLLETRVSEDLRRLELTSGTPTAQTTAQPVVTTVTTTQKPFVKRDLKDDLLKRAADLEIRVTAEIKKLEATNKSELAVVLKQHETRVKALTSELKTATGPTAITLLERELTFYEERVAQEVRALEDAGLTKEQLLAKAVTLEKDIATEVKELEASGKTAVAAILRRESLQLEQIARALTLAKENFRIRVLEAEIRALEHRVSDELIRLESNGVSTATTGAQTATTAVP